MRNDNPPPGPGEDRRTREGMAKVFAWLAEQTRDEGDLQ